MVWTIDFFILMYELPALRAEHNVVQGNVTRVETSNASFESHLQQKENFLL
jgi:hypothetical protein